MDTLVHEICDALIAPQMSRIFIGCNVQAAPMLAGLHTRIHAQLRSMGAPGAQQAAMSDMFIHINPTNALEELPRLLRQGRSITSLLHKGFSRIVMIDDAQELAANRQALKVFRGFLAGLICNRDTDLDLKVVSKVMCDAPDGLYKQLGASRSPGSQQSSLIDVWLSVEEDAEEAVETVCRRRHSTKGTLQGILSDYLQRRIPQPQCLMNLLCLRHEAVKHLEGGVCAEQSKSRSTVVKSEQSKSEQSRSMEALYADTLMDLAVLDSAADFTDVVARDIMSTIRMSVLLLRVRDSNIINT